MNSNVVLGIGFVLAGVVSLVASSIFVIRLERIGARLHLSEAILGLVAALGADSPEITSSITALVNHQRGIAVGVVLGANVFNLAALLGLGALSAGRIALHRKVVILAGLPALLVAVMTTGLEHHVVGIWPVAIVLFATVIPYTAMLEFPRRVLSVFGLPPHAVEWVERAIAEDEDDLSTAIQPGVGSALDGYLALLMLALVVVASVVMERIASTIGTRGHLSSIVVGGIILAGVTSLPNAVAAIYLARHGRGAAALSTAMHSNMINVLAGLIIPSLFVGVGFATSTSSLLVLFYLCFTVSILVIAYWRKGLGRISGTVIVVAYLLCVWLMVRL